MMVRKTVAMTTGKKIGRRGGDESADGVTAPGWHPAARCGYPALRQTGQVRCGYAQ